MIFQAKRISSFIDHMQFPVNILSEKGSDVAVVADRAKLIALMKTESVIAVGSKTRIRHFRLNRPEQRMSELRIKLRGAGKFTAEDNKTTRLEGRTQSHIMSRCAAYNRVPLGMQA